MQHICLGVQVRLGGGRGSKVCSATDVELELAREVLRALDHDVVRAGCDCELDRRAEDVNLVGTDLVVVIVGRKRSDLGCSDARDLVIREANARVEQKLRVKAGTARRDGQHGWGVNLERIVPFRRVRVAEMELGGGLYKRWHRKLIVSCT